MADDLHVMIVEDSDADRFFLRRAIRKCCPGTQVVEFAYAEEALRFLRSANRPAFDVIFVDINMPRMGGFEFVDAYARLYPELKGAARLWVLSHSIDPRDRVRAEAHPEVAGFLSKVYDRQDVARILGLDGRDSAIRG